MTGGSGTDQLTFQHQITSGENDLDGITVVSAIAINGGTIRDAAGNNANLSFTAPDLSGVFVDTSAPINIALSASTIDENKDTAEGSVTIGALSASEMSIFALVAGAGDTDNARFTIENGELKIQQGETIDFETRVVLFRIG